MTVDPSLAPVAGSVARLVTDDELLINRGLVNAVRVGMEFAVLDPTTRGVSDPDTGEDLGSIDRVKAYVRVTQVGDRLALARIVSRPGLSALASVVSGRQPYTLSSSRWPEGVAARDPVVSTGRIYHGKGETEADPK